MTAREEVEAILRGDWRLIGLEGPASGIGWVSGFLQSVRAECGGLDLSTDPFDLARAAGFRVRSIYLPGHCGASTATTLWVQSQGDDRDRALSCAHELLHGVGARRGLDHTEAAWWLATGGFVARAAQTEAGALRYPFWMLAAVPRSLIPR